MDCAYSIDTSDVEYRDHCKIMVAISQETSAVEADCAGSTYAGLWRFTALSQETLVVEANCSGSIEVGQRQIALT